MKRYTIQFDLLEGCDEFWESDPSPADVLSMVKQSMEDGSSGYNDYEKFKCVKVVDTHEYYPKVVDKGC